MSTTKTKLKIQGMHCTACAMSIDFDLEDIDGVIETKTSYASQETEVAFDENKTTIKDILNQVKKTGYTARVVE